MNGNHGRYFAFLYLVLALPSSLSAEEPLLRHALTNHSEAVMSVAYSPDGKMLATGSRDRTARLWTVATGKELTVFKDHSCGVGTVAFSPDGKTLAAAISGSPGIQPFLVKLWDVAKGCERAALKGSSACGGVGTVAFSPDGKTVASATAEGTIKLRDVATGDDRATLSVDTHYVTSLAFNPDGKTLAWAGKDQTVKLWDLASGKERATLSGHAGGVRCVVFSPDGRFVASASDDQTMRLWDAGSGNQRATFEGHTARVRCVAFGPDGKTLASASDDKTVRLWEVATGKQRATLDGHTKKVIAVAYSPDGTTLASAGEDKTIRVWDDPLTSKAASVRSNVLMAAALDQLWKTLAGEDAEQAYQAVGTFVGANDRAVVLARARLQPAPAPNVEQVARWIGALDSDQFAVRQRATDELAKLGEQAVPALRTKLTERPSPEARQRIEALLSKIDQEPLAGDAVRGVRAVEVLERIGSAEARKVLAALATGADGCRLTSEARASLERLQSRVSAEK